MVFFTKFTTNSLFAFLNICFLEVVDAKYCWYSGEDGLTKYYRCSVYEHCCSRGCCDNYMSFYRLWYFWFCILMILMFCSGGSYWYKKRYIRQRIVVDQPCSVNNTTILTVGSANQHIHTNMAGWDPYANVGRPVLTSNMPATVQGAQPVNTGLTYFTPPPAYSAVVNQSHVQTSSQQQAPPPSYASTMVLDATNPANQNPSQLTNMS